MTIAAVLLTLLLQEDPRFFDPDVHEATKTFKIEDFRVVPVRVHRLQSPHEDALQCRLEEDDLRRVFGKINRIWNKAGLALAIESIRKEDALVPKDFDAGALEEFRGTRPADSRPAGMIHVYYVHQLPTNGVFMGRDAIFVKDTASLRLVKGGVDEPLPRVSAHEIGHAMGLSHRQDTINLMASGTTGWSINDGEIDRVRAWADQQDWVLTPAAAIEKGYGELLLSLPGDSELKEKARAAVRKASGQ
ncbi:MAG: matrixin family metalloprotease [Planctomycetaceae bacterium]|nr:matrixin family metalloprotease [Planctomycetaceae bacterium]